MILQDKKALYKRIICWTLVIICMTAIFIFSNQPEVQSQKITKPITTIVSDAVGNSTGHNSNAYTIGVIIRKIGHTIGYFLLSILFILALAQYPINKRKVFILPILFCFLYACSDEWHQTFVKNRTGRPLDVLIDTAGATVAVLIVLIIIKIVSLIKKRKILKLVE